MIIDKKLRDRFFYRVQRTDKCWYWKGKTNNEEVGMFMIGGRWISAHRFSYILHYGDIGKHDRVERKCRCRICVRPDHLELKKRYVIDVDYLRGVKNGTIDTDDTIKKMVMEGQGWKLLGKKYTPRKEG